MKLFKIIFEVRYPQNKPEIFNFREKIFSKIASGNQKLPDLQDGFEFLLKDRHIKVVVDSKRFGMDIAFNNSIPNPVQYGQNNIIKIIQLINSELSVKNVERIGIRTNWLQEVDISINELVNKFKDAFFKENEIIKSSKDVAIVLTLEDGRAQINYTAGPMDDKQALGILNSNLEQVGFSKVEKVKTSVFVDYDYFIDQKTEFSEDFYKNFVHRGIEESEKIVGKTCRLLGV